MFKQLQTQVDKIQWRFVSIEGYLEKVITTSSRINIERLEGDFFLREIKE